ncbi:MAG TPA: chemotaxis protein CheX [Tepidisphaeraceae bacterium]|nr:chemotaxis protein CheX [Tepidisphaeraceae bacterium]
MSESATIKPQVNQSLFLPFFESTREVLSMMAGIEVKVGKPYKKRPPFNYYDVTGQINFYGDVVGVASVCMLGDTADQIIERFACTKLERGTGEYTDAVGELANMISGSAKKNLGVNASITTPNVILGRHTVVPSSAVPCVVIPGSCPFGEFAIEVSIKLVSGSSGGR